MNQQKHPLKSTAIRLFQRVVTSWLAVILAVTTCPAPVLAQEPVAPQVVPPAPKAALGPREKAAKVKAVKRSFNLAKSPADLAIATSRSFSEPLVPMAVPPVPGENDALSKALTAFKSKNNPEDLSDLSAFLKNFPASRWRASLELNMGLLRKETGYFSDSLSLLKSAWENSKNQTGRQQKLVAQKSISELLNMQARLGRREDLRKGLAEIKNRPIVGSAADRIESAREGLYAMDHAPKLAYKCGPYALDALLRLRTPSADIDPRVKAFPSSSKGTNLSQLKDWSDQLQLNLQIAKRSPGASIVVPSLAHWRAGHYAAITSFNKDRYHVQDPTFERSGSMWLSPAAIDTESDGYFLIPAGPLPTGWKSVSRDEAKSVWGKGNSNNRQGPTPSDPKKCPSGSCDCNGLARLSLYSMQAQANIQDVPLSYSNPFSQMEFRVNYNDDEAGQPGIFTFPNLTPNWSFNFVSWITLDASQNADVHVRGGGVETFKYSNPNNISNPYPPALTSQAVLTIPIAGVYNRQLPDGTIEVFNLADGAGNTFLTQIIDPQGNITSINYDTDFRITGIVDPNQNTTTLTYVTPSGVPTDPGFYVIAAITDPFGRSANFSYDPTLSYLLSITDSVSLVSKFTYDFSNGTITTLNTPYGTTFIKRYTPSGTYSFPPRGLRVTLPDGSASLIENWIGEDKVTYFWDRHALELYPTDAARQVYSHCQTTRWLINPDNLLLTPVMDWQKMPLEAEVDYSYNIPAFTAPVSNQPNLVSRILSGTSVQVGTLTGGVAAGDILTLTVFNSNLAPTGQTSVQYTALPGDSENQVATGIAAAVNASTALQGINVTASATGSQIRLIANNAQATSYLGSFSAGSVATINIVPEQNLPYVITVSGSATPGDTVAITVIDPAIPSGQAVISYSVLAGDDLNAVTLGLFNAVLNNEPVKTINLIPSISGTVLTLQSFSGSNTLYNVSTTPPTATEILTPSVPTVVQRTAYQYNSLGKVTQMVDPVGRTFSYRYAGNDIDLLEIRETQGSDNFLLGKWQYNSQHVPTVYIDGSARKSLYGYNVFGQRVSMTDPNSNLSTWTYTSTMTATISGTINANDVAGVTVIDPALPGGQQAVSYTAVGGDTATTMATNLKNNINGNANLQTLGVSATSSGAVISIKSNSVNATTYSKTQTGLVVTLSTVVYGFLSSTRGPLQQQDISSFTWDAKGTLASATNSQGYTLAFQYDAMDRLIKTTYPDGTSDQTRYVNLDPVFSIDRLGRTTQRGYDSLDQQIFEIDPLGRKTQYSWCTCGSLSALTDAANHTTSWQHDLQGRITKKVFADSTDIDYEYEGNISRLKKRTDALNQKTNYSYNVDNTLKVVSYDDEINPTSDVQYTWDSKFNRLTKVENGWGNYQYGYNPYITDPFGTSTTGGGRLQQVTNSVIPNSAITFSYDALGRTTNRSINGSANSITWTFDPMSRVTQEVNALGTFGYTYLDNTSPNSKGDTRLASISYPNGQATNFSWFDNNRDQRLREISNLDPSSQAISQFGYAHDAAGQITRWSQQQKGRNQNAALDYDPAGQLTGSIAGRGTTASPNADQYFYGYDAAANRTAVQTSQVQNFIIAGSKTTGDVITITVSDSGLSGGSLAVPYTVLAADTLSSIATNLAATLTATASLQGLGIDAVASGTTVSIRSKSPNVTASTASLSGGATETVTAAVYNTAQNITIGGTAHVGDALQVIVRDSALSGGQTTVNYTVPASPTLNSIASGLAAAINAGSGLSALGVTAAAAGRVVTVKSTSQNLTSYSGSVSGAGATTTMSLGLSANGTTTALIAGSKTTGDIVSLTVLDRGLPGGSKSVNYTVLSGDNLTSITSGLTTAINGDTDLQGVGVTASASGTKLTLTSVSISATTYVPATKNSAGTALGSETILCGLPANGTATAAISGTVASSDQFTLAVFDADPSVGSIAKTVTGVTSPNAVASALATAINGDANLTGIGVTAAAAIPTASVSVVNISSTSNNATTYTFSRTGSAVIALSKNVGVSQATFNNVNELTAIAAGGATRFQGSTDKPVLPSMTVDSGAVSTPTSSSFNANPTLNSGAESVAVSATAGGAGGATTTNNYKFDVVGAASQSLTFDANGNMTSDGTNSYAWDAENRLIQITYPGTGNTSQFIYDPLGRNVRIDEVTGGGAPTIKQFVWCSGDRCEERDSGGSVTKQFFSRGQRNTSTNYFYSQDHLGSIRGLTDNSGVAQAGYSFDPYGQVTKLQETVASDFGFAGYYLHARSGLNLTRTRAYNPVLGRWINRDPIAERGGTNLYGYVSNNPISLIDAEGTDPTIATVIVAGGASGAVIGAGASTVVAMISLQGIANGVRGILQNLDQLSQNSCINDAVAQWNDCIQGVEDCHKDDSPNKQEELDRCYADLEKAVEKCIAKHPGNGTTPVVVIIRPH